MDAALSFVDRLARHDPRCGPTWAGTPAADQEHARVTAEFWLEMLWHEFGLSPRLLRAACWLAECLRRCGLTKAVIPSLCVSRNRSR